jgi:hypothetical protein
MDGSFDLLPCFWAVWLVFKTKISTENGDFARHALEERADKERAVAA